MQIRLLNVYNLQVIKMLRTVCVFVTSGYFVLQIVENDYQSGTSNCSINYTNIKRIIVEAQFHI